MKRLSLFVAALLFSAVALAQNGRIQLRSESRAEITKSEFTTLRAVFSYGSVESIEINTERGVFSEIILPGTYASGALGTPELPATHKLLAVPFGATPTVRVVNYTTTDYKLSDYGIHTILPHQPSVRKDQAPDDIEFLYDETAYQSRSLATVPTASIEVQGTMRGIRIGSLLVNPLSYNAASNTLRVFNDIEVEINFEGADYAQNERMLVNTYSPYFDIVYKQMFNYRQINDVYTDHPDLMAYPVHMIVVAPENYLSTLQPWTNWKIQKGFDVNLVTTAQAGSNYNSIRNYVQNLYNSGVQSGSTPTFVILVGDVAQVPNTIGNSSQKVTDLYYASVDGDDFPDMFYSRMSAESTSQLTAIINKILQYEQYTMPDPSYLNKVTLIAGWDSYWNPRVGQPTINYATTYYYNTAHGFSQVNAHLNQSQYNGCYNALNSGVGFVNYTAHGSETFWDTPRFTISNVNQLTNTNKYFLAMGNCCLAANFGYSSPCFGEAMIRAENKGAFSYIGSCPSSYWYEDYYFAVGATNTFSSTPNINNSATGVYDGIWMDETYNTVSSIPFLGNLAVCHAHAGNYQGSVSNQYYWQSYHVLGDGSVMPYRVQPTANNVSHASTFTAGTNTFSVNAQAGSYVGISQNNVLLGAALIGNSGSANVNVTPVSSGNVTIVVTKPQRQPYIATIPVGGGGSSTYTIATSASPSNGGTTSGGGTFQQGQSCTVHASANSGFSFTNWTENGNVVSNNANYSFTVNGNRSLVANFNPVAYTITTTASPSNGGTTSGGGTFQQGQSCTVHASANSGFSFTNWTENGNVVSNNANYSFTVNGNRSLVANFNPVAYTITTTANPTNGGSVSGGGSYNAGATCTVNATANPGYDFVNWTSGGSIVSTQASYSFTVNGSRSLVAHFATATYTVSVETDPSKGTVTGGGSFTYGQTCAIQAIANEHYHFVAWTENGNVISEQATYLFDVTRDYALFAEFEETAILINATADPTEGGTLTGTGAYSFGTTVTLEAVANTHYTFINWTENGNVVAEEATYSFTATDDRNLIAHFDYFDAIDESHSNCLVYPNPVSDKIHIEHAEEINSIEVYNQAGLKIISHTHCGNHAEISMKEMPNGIYFMHVTTNTTTEILKLIKE